MEETKRKRKTKNKKIERKKNNLKHFFSKLHVTKNEKRKKKQKIKRK